MSQAPHSNVLIRDVIGSSLADRSNFKAGDVIQAVNGKPVFSQTDVFNELDKLSGLGNVEFTVLRENTLITLLLKI